MTRLQLLGVTLAIVAVSMTYAASRAMNAQQLAARHSHQNAALAYGTIMGRVLDSEGQPVMRAEVYAVSVDSGNGRVPTVYTNSQGAFLIRNLPPGTYRVAAAKRSDGYPPTDNPFLSTSSEEPPQVTVYAGQTSSDITIHFGPKAARLIGQIMDAATSRALRDLHDVQITLRRVDRPDDSYSTGAEMNGNFSILVPPVPFTVEVTAPGYEHWQHRRGELHNQTDALQIAPGQTRRLNIAMRRIR